MPSFKYCPCVFIGVCVTRSVIWIDVEFVHLLVRDKVYMNGTQHFLLKRFPFGEIC